MGLRQRTDGDTVIEVLSVRPPGPADNGEFTCEVGCKGAFVPEMMTRLIHVNAN